jgi:hypothetical protein
LKLNPTALPARIVCRSSIECLPSPPTGSALSIAVASGSSRVLSSSPPSMLSSTAMRSRWSSVGLRLTLRPLAKVRVRTSSRGSLVLETTVPGVPKSV